MFHGDFRGDLRHYRRLTKKVSEACQTCFHLIDLMPRGMDSFAPLNSSIDNKENSSAPRLRKVATMYERVLTSRKFCNLVWPPTPPHGTRLNGRPECGPRVYPSTSSRFPRKGSPNVCPPDVTRFLSLLPFCVAMFAPAEEQKRKRIEPKEPSPPSSSDESNEHKDCPLLLAEAIVRVGRHAVAALTTKKYRRLSAEFSMNSPAKTGPPPLSDDPFTPISSTSTLDRQPLLKFSLNSSSPIHPDTPVASTRRIQE